MVKYATRPTIFKWRQTAPELILCAVRWYLRYSLSLRDVEELFAERGLEADHTTIWRWVQRYGPELQQRLRRHLKPTNKSWRVDETYIRVQGRWCYLYRAIDSTGATIDFKTVDAGRKLSRGALYQFADRLLATEIVMSRKQPLLVNMTMDGRFPTEHQHQNALVRILERLIERGGTREAGPDCDVSVETLTAEELERRARMELDEFEHRLAIKGLVVSFRSRKSDQ
jgi:hypothetical protein